MLTGDMLRRSAERFPAKPAIIWQDVAVVSRARRPGQPAGAALLGLGLNRARRSRCVAQPAGIRHHLFGTARTGCVLVNVSVLYSPEELPYVLDKADVEVLIYEDVFAEKVASVRDRLPAEATVRDRKAQTARRPFAIPGRPARHAPGRGHRRGRPVLHDLHRRHDRPAEGRARKPPRPRGHGAHRHGRGGDRRARRGRRSSRRCSTSPR